MKIRISNKNNRFKIKKIPIKQLCRSVLHGELNEPNCELDITIVSDEEIAKLNERYLQHEGATDVLSFPQIEQNQAVVLNCQLGDIVVSSDMAFEQSKTFHTTFNQEFGLYIIHGILHLLGYDDREESDKLIMESKQEFWFNTIVTKNDMEFICHSEKGG